MALDVTPQRKATSPSDFADLDALAQRILDFQDRFNATAEPFDWTFTRDGLHTLLARIDAHEPTATPHAA